MNVAKIERKRKKKWKKKTHTHTNKTFENMNEVYVRISVDGKFEESDEQMYEKIIEEKPHLRTKTEE